jgi:hypothetical protein
MSRPRPTRNLYAGSLGTTNAPVAVIKDLMRHADIRTTFDQYGNGLPARRVKPTAKSCEWFYAERFGIL